MMLPIVLDLARVPVALVGRDAQALKRLRHLEADGVARVRVFSDAPSDGLRGYAGERLIERLPTAADLAGSRVVFIADLPPEEIGDIATAAAVAGALLEALFPAVWTERVVELGRLRRRLRAHGLAAEVRSATEALIANRSWLPAIDDAEARRHAHR
jgi:precorrin-2 dehydrogenase / sirohydrochlorin ferrochelatase